MSSRRRASPTALPLAQILFSQGFGTRRHCAALIDHGLVRVEGQTVDDGDALFETAGLQFEVQGKTWPFHEQALILLNKPAGYECSRKPRHHPGVLSLLPEPLRQREVQPVGRLDEDTTGLLLLTDDGQLLHQLASPKHHVPKVYHARCKHPLTENDLQALRDGVLLHEDDPRLADKPARAEAAELLPDGQLQLTLTEGRYHQVKRMVAAVGNRVEALHRAAYGALWLPEDLAPGQWRWLEGGLATIKGEGKT
ncbi:16S rRNA pseudouridine(516) synthase [Pelomonas sp. CA6]|uniref:pseudouridine synthase n=1 Tax=Pelomonas sp. CA6 TaxID=2907999 RepID=UPI001F4BD5A2|nr:16S rRNA pseudouridine(516) synthase [Pelomonas sp. CA6]MCH7345033.1 16S rRNA pseudouridine(516) synthase [Pelomonas sp. CA6]